MERGPWSTPVELIPASEQYWVLLTDVSCADVNKVLEIYEEATERCATSMEEKDFERLKDEFENGGIGVIQWEIATQRNLEWRRLVNPEGVYVRFKFGGGDLHNSFHVNGVEKTIRTQIDDYFKNRGKPLSELV